MNYTDIYSFIKQQEAAYLKPISLEDGWNWNMKEHLRRSFLYKHAQFEQENDNRDLRPFINIVKPILNIAYRTEGFDVKDIELYVSNPDTYYKSFLVRKFHEKWALENFIDTAIDESVESYDDYGGVLVENTDEVRPKIIELRSLAFCNQRNILANPFAIKYSFSPSQLREHAKWNDVERLITLCKDEEEIEVYKVVGTLPAQWLDDNKKSESDKDKKDIQQVQVVAYYKDENQNEVGITLFSSKLPKLNYKLLKRDDIKDRALGYGGVEELFDPQVWRNWNEVKITEMLDAASKTLFKSTDPSFKTRNNLRNVDNLEVLQLQAGGDINQLDTFPRNITAFEKDIERLETRAQLLGSASDPALGESPSSGTPFKLYEAQNIEGKGMHRYRQGKLATFWDEIYRDWILPHIAREIANDHEFLAELSADEMREVSDKLVIHQSNRAKIEKILKGGIPVPEEIEELETQVRDNFMRSGNRKFLKILKGEMKDKLGVLTNIVGKQKNLALLTDKFVNVLRQFIATPQLRQDPEMVKLLNTILESSGMSPIMFGSAPIMREPQQGGTEPLKELSAKPLEMQNA